MRATIVPARGLTAPVVSGVMVPKPPLYKPLYGPEVNVVGAVAKLPRLIAEVWPVAIAYCTRLKIFVNSARICRT